MASSGGFAGLDDISDPDALFHQYKANDAFDYIKHVDDEVDRHDRQRGEA